MDTRPDISAALPLSGQGEGDLTSLPFMGGRAVADAAHALLADHGGEAGDAAALRAAHARAHDNPWRYCQWREVARLLDLPETPSGRVH